MTVEFNLVFSELASYTFLTTETIETWETPEAVPDYYFGFTTILGEGRPTWDDSSTSYASRDIYIFGTTEFDVELPGLSAPTKYCDQ